MSHARARAASSSSTFSSTSTVFAGPPISGNQMPRIIPAPTPEQTAARTRLERIQQQRADRKRAEEEAAAASHWIG